MGLNVTLVTVAANTIIHAADSNTNWQNLNAATTMLDSTNSAHEVIGHDLLGSSDTGMYNFTDAISIGSGAGSTYRFNNYYDPTLPGDRFMNTISSPAYMFIVGSSGVQCKKSTANGTAGAAITWGSPTTLFS